MEKTKTKKKESSLVYWGVSSFLFYSSQTEKEKRHGNISYVTMRLESKVDVSAQFKIG